MLHGFFYNYMYKKTPCLNRTRSFFETMEFRLVCFARIYLKYLLMSTPARAAFSRYFLPLSSSPKR